MSRKIPLGIAFLCPALLLKSCLRPVSAGSGNAVAADTAVHQVHLSSIHQTVVQIRGRGIRKEKQYLPHQMASHPSLESVCQHWPHWLAAALQRGFLVGEWEDKRQERVSGKVKAGNFSARVQLPSYLFVWEQRMQKYFSQSSYANLSCRSK